MHTKRLRVMSKRASIPVASRFSELLITVVFLSVFSVLIIGIFLIFFPLIQVGAERAYDNAIVEGNTIAASLWNIVSSDAVLYILAVVTYIIMIIGTIASMLTKSTKNNT